MAWRVVRLRAFGACGPILGPAAVALLLLAGFFAWSEFRFGSIRDGVAYCNGYLLVAGQPEVDLGPVKVGSCVGGCCYLKNLTDVPVMVLGATPDCSCITVSGVPMRVAPHGSTKLPFVYCPRAGSGSRRETRLIRVYIDADSPELLLPVRADVIAVGGRPDAVSQR